MIKRSFVFVLLAISIVWIAYIGLTLSKGSSNAPTPQSIFSTADDTIVVVHHVHELNFKIPVLRKIQQHDFYTTILANQERIQHFYFGTKNEVVLLERSKPWSNDLVYSYISKLMLSASISASKNISLSNGWKGNFHGKYLVFYKHPIQALNTSSIDWNYLDKKSSYSIVSQQPDNQFSIENCYFLNHSTQKYIAKQNNASLPLVNDQEIFQEYIPSNFETYAFYEQNYLKSLYPQKSIIDEWMNFGCALITNKKDSCLISDFKLGVNPLESLSETPGVVINSKTKQAEIKGQTIPLLNPSKTYYLEVFNNVVYISSSKTFINQLIGDYETGNSLAQSVTLKDKLLTNATQSVSYRLINDDRQETMSRLTNVDYQTIALYSDKISNQEAESETTNQLNPIRLDDDLIALKTIPNSNNIIAITHSNTLYLVGLQKVKWSKQLESSVIGEPVFIGNGIFVATREMIYAFDLNGGNLSGFPIKQQHVISELYPFYWSGKDYISFATEKEVLAYTTAGKLNFRGGLSKTITTSASVVVQGKKGDLIAHVCSENSWLSVSIKRNKLLASKKIVTGNWQLIKVDGTVSLIGTSNKKFARLAENGNQSILINQASDFYISQNIGSETYFILSQGNQVYVISDRGLVNAQFSTKTSEISDMSFFKEKKIVGVLDGISNNCYIYSTKGQKIGKTEYKGSNKMCFQTLTDGTPILISQSNGYLVRYTLN